jgi:hypothetical protein
MESIDESASVAKLFLLGLSVDDQLHQNPTVSVISMAARSKPGVVKEAGRLTYKVRKTITLGE